MRIAFTVKDDAITNMHDADKAIIFDNGKIERNIDLATAQQHPALNKLMQIFPLKVDGVVTERVGQPGVRLAENYSVNVYLTTGDFSAVIRGIENNSILPVRPGDAPHHCHDREHHE